MLRLHRVGIGTFAAMFGLMVLGSSVRGEDDPFVRNSHTSFRGSQRL
jgi:hypothetical protein